MRRRSRKPVERLDIDEYRYCCVICRRKEWSNLCKPCRASLVSKYGSVPNWADQMRKWQNAADKRYCRNKSKSVSMEDVRETESGFVIAERRRDDEYNRKSKRQGE